MTLYKLTTLGRVTLTILLLLADLALFFLLFFLSSIALGASALTVVLYITLALLVYIPLAQLWGARAIGTLLRRTVPLIALGVCVLTGGLLIAYEAWESKLARVNDELLLRHYEPFVAESALARLEGDASLYMTDELPRLDCATALYPLVAAFTEAVYPASPEGYGDRPYNPYGSESLLQSSGTATAYERLIAGDCDMIFAAWPSEEHFQLAADRGVELVLTPVGLEAFVFFVNAKNPVATLSSEQLRSIYAGTTTSWSEVGGRGRAIRAFQRPVNSGSQTTLLGFMGDTPLMAAPEENVASLMSGIIRRTADYKNFANAIGYSFRYYATEMVQENEIKLLAVDGVFPTTENIRLGRYPITAPYYAVTVRQRDGLPNWLLIDWILSAEGQALTEATGYVPIVS